MTSPILAAGLLSTLGLASSLAIYLAHRVLPKEDPSLEEATKIKGLLPGADCGACGKPGCFAYAQAVAARSETLLESPCRVLAADREAHLFLGEYLGITLEADASVDAVRAVVHCAGDSQKIAEYSGIQSCAAANQVAGGFKACAFGCLGLGDCAGVCPVDAISVSDGPATVDWSRCIGCGACVEVCPKRLIELVSAAQPQYLGCNYLAGKDIPERPKCSEGCLHCRICVRVSPEEDEVSWNDALDLPQFTTASAQTAIEKCPRSIIRRTQQTL